MKVQFDHLVLSSFYLWLDDHLLNVAEAVIQPPYGQDFNYSAPSQESPLLTVPSNLNAFYSADRQLVGNGPVCETGLAPGKQGVPGSDGNFIFDDDGGVPTGIFWWAPGVAGYDWADKKFEGDNGETDSPPIMIDFDQGRVLFNPDGGSPTATTNIQVSGHFRKKTVNVYLSADDEVTLLNKSFTLARDGNVWKTNQENTKADPGDFFYTIPAVFISYNGSTNQPFALGGEDNTRIDIRVVCVTENNYDLDALLSTFRDVDKSCFTVMPYDSFPYGDFYTLKTPPYIYSDLVGSYGTNKKMFIQRVIVSKLYDRSSNKDAARGLKIGFADFQLETARFPRVDPTAL